MRRRRSRERPRARKPALNARQAAFVRHYTAGADGVRGNQTRAYIAAGYSPNGAHKLAARLMAKDDIRRAVEAVHAAAERAAAKRLRDWKELAPAAQKRLVAIARGRIPHGETISGRDEAAAANVILAANREILERAEPKKLRVAIDDPAGALAQILGVKPEDVPLSDDEE